MLAQPPLAANWIVSLLCCTILQIGSVSAQVVSLPAVPPTGPTAAEDSSYATFFTNSGGRDAGDAETSVVNPAAKADTDEENDSELEKRVDDLEKNYEALGEKNAELEDENSGLKKQLKNLVASGHSGSTMKINGRIHLDHWAFPRSSTATNIFETNNDEITPQDRIGFRRLRFSVGGDLWETMVYKLEAEMAGGNDFELRDAYLGMEDLPFLQTVLIGNQKRPYGLDQLHSSRFTLFVERPFMIEATNQDTRRLGVQSYGVSEDQSWNWRYGLFNQRLIQDEGNYISDHYQMEVAGRLANTFWYDKASDGRTYSHWAISGTSANTDGNGSGLATNEARFRVRPEARSVNRWIDTGVIASADDYRLLGLESVWNFGPMQIGGEYQGLWLDRDVGNDLHFNGSYAYVSYFLTGEHVSWNRSRGILDRVKPFQDFFLVDRGCRGVSGGWGAWQVAYRWSYADFNDNDIFGGRGVSHTLGLNWYWNPYAGMQFNAIYGKISDHSGFDDTDNNPATALIPTGPISGDYTVLGTRFRIDF